MSLHYHKGQTVRDVKRVFVNDAGTVREVQGIYVRRGGIIRRVFSPFVPGDPALSLAVDQVIDGYEYRHFTLIGDLLYHNGQLVGGAPNFIDFSQRPNTRVGGGSGSYTADWTRLSGEPGIECTFNNILDPTFSARVAKDSTLTAVWRLNVNSGSQNRYVDVTVQFFYVRGPF